MSQRTYKQIPEWKLGPVTIYPSLKWGTTYSFEQITQFANQLAKKIQLPENVSINVFPVNSYCSEVNGRWNVSFGIVQRTETKTITYMYMIRRDTDLDADIGGTYACPFFNYEYCYEKHSHTSLSQKKEFLTLVETTLQNIMGAATKITHFHT